MQLQIIGCWGGYPKANEASSGYLLECEGFHLLIDCGSGVLSKLQNTLKPEQIDAVIVSHYHSDHIADIGVLQHARLIQGILAGTLPNLPIYGHQLNAQEFEKLTYKQITKGIAYEPIAPLNVGPFKIQFLQTAHPVPCFAMRIEAKGKVLVYTADTSFKPELIDFSKDADVLLCECNFYGNLDGKAAGHMRSFDCGTLASKANVKELVLTHLPHFGNLQQLVEEAGQHFTGKIQLAFQDLKIIID
ncbi:MBL fold metallo-hydrolase [Bacillus marasmi]|uniref:MBL fold metallo-hydrolase n=1 Tax=Bacillus marasmi TaxID=1926279 RepID=UPI0011CAA4F9|nr:MBL fold metallo-hydrolase [Bacillus marasmi]